MKIKLSEIEEKLYLLGYSCVLIAFLLQISNLPDTYSFLYVFMGVIRRIGYFLCC